MRPSWRTAALVAAAFLVVAPAAPAGAEPALPAGAAQATPAAPPPSDPPTTDPTRRDDLLGAGWQRSGDRLWTTSGDGAGFHVLVAEAKTGYSWRTAATLAVPGVDADQWIGNACVTGSGQRAVVVYAPRTYTNDQTLTSRGGYTAIVDLASGAITRLPIRTSLAYFNPGCGTGETVALTQEGDEDLGKTDVLMLDASTGKVGARTELAGQVTSATPVTGGFVVADQEGLLKVGTDGAKTRLVGRTDGVPFDVKADAEGGVVFMDRNGPQARVFRVTPGKPAVTALATGKFGRLSVTAAAGKVFITGDTDTVAALPATVAKLSAPAQAEVSTLGEAVVTAKQTVAKSIDPSRSALVHVQASSVRTGKQLAFTVDPDATLKPRWTDTTDPDHVCSVPRNDPAAQVYQPKPKQVEWAADMAVKGDLLIGRPAGWRNNGIGSYVPQQMFPPIPLSTGGQVPAQILLGVMGQESNLWQAARSIYPGETGNPLIGNYYGVDPKATGADYWTINWDKADCGYGVTQVTDGMRLPGHPSPSNPNDPPLPHDQQVAIATDYAANVAAGLRILQQKWNQMQAVGLTVNNGDPSKIENWFYATWAYNSGYHNPGEAGANGAYGLGWLNNPANPRYDPNRHAFGSDPHDFAKPQNWPYEEKVLGFATYPPSGFESPGVQVPFFRAAWWNTDAQRAAAVPAPQLLCTSANDCAWGTLQTPSAPDVTGEPDGPCQHKDTNNKYDLKCWVHTAVTWNPDCANTCGHEFIRYDYPQYKDEQPDGTSNPPTCGTTGLFADAQGVDDVPNGFVPVEQNPNCHPGTSTGSFDLTFAGPAAKIDLHQVGGGYGAHFWYSHARPDGAEGQKIQITGTWTFSQFVDGLADVLVHLPVRDNSGGGTVTYVVDNTTTGSHQVTVNTALKGENWVDLGAFSFAGQPKVHLSTLQAGSPADGSEEVYWDAAAIEPDENLHNPSTVSFANDGTGLCMMLRGNTTANGAVVEQRTCTSFGANYWDLDQLGTATIPGDGDRFKDLIIDRGSLLCLTVADDSTNVDAPIVEAPCNADDPSQQWLLPDAGATPASASELIQNVRSAYFIAPQNGNKANLTPLTQQPLHTPTDTTQAWYAASS